MVNLSSRVIIAILHTIVIFADAQLAITFVLQDKGNYPYRVMRRGSWEKYNARFIFNSGTPGNSGNVGNSVAPGNSGTQP